MADLAAKASQLGVTVAETQGRAQALSRAAGWKLEQARNQTAGAMRTAASSIRTAAGSAANSLDATASRVEHYKVQDLLAGCRQLIRRNPAGTFAAAAAIGFLAASAARHILHTCPKQPETN